MGLHLSLLGTTVLLHVDVDDTDPNEVYKLHKITFTDLFPKGA